LKESAKGVLDEKHGFVWCFCASLSLLPVIEINKEFTEFSTIPNANPPFTTTLADTGSGGTQKFKLRH
jgi:hypothetical protein